MDGPEHFHWCSIRSLNKRVVQILTWNNLRFYSQTACGAMKMAVYWSLWSSSGTSSDFGGVATWGLYTLKKNERLVRLKVTNNWKNSNIIWTENLQPTTWFFNRRFFLSITYLGGFHQTSEDCLNLGGGKLPSNQSSVEVLEGLRNAYGNLPLSVAQGEDSEFLKTNGLLGGRLKGRRWCLR